MNNLIYQIELFSKKNLPALPLNMKEGIVRFLPWAVIISIVFSWETISALFNAFMGSTGNFGIMNDLFDAVGYSSRRSIMRPYNFLFIGGVILRLISIKGLFKFQKSGWNFLFYFSIVHFASAFFKRDPVVDVVYAVGLVYALFQIKDYYFGLAKLRPLNQNPNGQPIPPQNQAPQQYQQSQAPQQQPPVQPPVQSQIPQQQVNQSQPQAQPQTQPVQQQPAQPQPSQEQPQDIPQQPPINPDSGMPKKENN